MSIDHRTSIGGVTVGRVDEESFLTKSQRSASSKVSSPTGMRVEALRALLSEAPYARTCALWLEATEMDARFHMERLCGTSIEGVLS
jgi:hypothetical protein